MVATRKASHEKSIQQDNVSDWQREIVVTLYIDEEQNRFWLEDGEKHRENGPAVEWANGNKEWLKRGMLCRSDGPTLEWGRHRRHIEVRHIKYEDKP